MRSAIALALALVALPACTGDDLPNALGLSEVNARETAMGRVHVTRDAKLLVGIQDTPPFPTLAQYGIANAGALAYDPPIDAKKVERLEVDDNYVFTMTDDEVTRYRVMLATAPLAVGHSTLGARLMSFSNEHVFHVGDDVRLFDRATYLTGDTTSADVVATIKPLQGAAAVSAAEKDGVVWIGTGGRGVFAYDLADPSVPLYWLGSFLGGTVVVDGDRLITSLGYDTEIYDVTDARHPTEIANVIGGGSHFVVRDGLIYGVDRTGIQVIDGTTVVTRLEGRGECFSIQVTDTAVFASCEGGEVYRFE